MIVIIDNYDSFTYNLYQYVGEINPDVQVFRNDQITVDELKELAISHIIISPGPGFPKDSGISMDVIKEFGRKIPTLGVCLGHQAIGQVFGADIQHARKMVHGKTSLIDHQGKGLFKGLRCPLKVTRYHSLIVKEDSVPDALMVTATSSDGEIMALQHRELPIYGVQFHPESIATEGGKRLLSNFLLE